MPRIEDLSLFEEIGRVLSRPNHGFLSWGGITKRLRLQGDDRPRRAVSRMEAAFHTSLVESKAGRLSLTEAGRKVYEQVFRLLSLRNSLAEDEQAEPVVVEMHPDLASWVLPAVLPGFLETFADTVQLRVSPLDARIRDNIGSGITSFGLGIESLDGSPSESIETGLAWHLLLPPLHRLLELEPDEKVQLGPVDRVFLVEGMPVSEQDAFIQHAPARVWCPDFGTVRNAVPSGLGGVGIVPSFLATEDLHSIRLVDLPRIRLALFLPRDIESLSDPAQSLLQSIREFVAVTASEPAVEAEAESEDSMTEGEAEELALSSEETP
jgi:DNA-binding transcriptional LysR family regulator